MFFKGKEFTMDGENVYDKMDIELMAMLEEAREKAGIPIVITSSYRTPEYNAKIGGKPNSAHLRGRAVDIAIYDGNQRYIIVKALLEAGFQRIGIGKTFLHADIDTQNLPAPVVWTY
jgi:zinc D-Ala-D-Ala carboxypeptidase